MAMSTTDPQADAVIPGELTTCPDCGQPFNPRLSTDADPAIRDHCAGEWGRRRRRWERRRRGARP
jgi:hypothetical protein